MVKPASVDRAVGERLRRRREQMGLSPTTLGVLSGLTAYQIQRHEEGTRRISASRLLELANVLGVPVCYFFEDIELFSSENGDAHATRTQEELVAFLRTPEARVLSAAFTAIADPKTKRSLLRLVQTLGAPMPGE